ncbi:MAG: hypothetical protein LBG27_13805 [Spirochaetaceae bacterium]|nr:hypothetical protein [Spirochaetaceae bacterium]
MEIYGVFDDFHYRALEDLPDRAFGRALPYFSEPVPGSPGCWRVNGCWLYPWAVADRTVGTRFSHIAPAVRNVWSNYGIFDYDNFLPIARQNRYAGRRDEND